MDLVFIRLPVNILSPGIFYFDWIRIELHFEAIDYLYYLHLFLPTIPRCGRKNIH